jgi:hypothetical protein
MSKTIDDPRPHNRSDSVPADELMVWRNQAMQRTFEAHHAERPVDVETYSTELPAGTAPGRRGRRRTMGGCPGPLQTGSTSDWYAIGTALNMPGRGTPPRQPGRCTYTRPRETG